MIYKFKSKAAGDVIMTGPSGDHILRIIGKEPAPKGIVLPADMPAAITALERAVLDEEAEALLPGVATRTARFDRLVLVPVPRSLARAVEVPPVAAHHA